jgi:hypothetical protein
VLVVLLFVLAETWNFAARPTRQEMIVAHMSFGILLTLVVVVRIAWRLTPGHRVRDAMTGLIERASKAVHYLLYVLLVAQVVLGFARRWSSGEALSFFGLLDHHYPGRGPCRGRAIPLLRHARRCALAHDAGVARPPRRGPGTGPALESPVAVRAHAQSLMAASP